LHCLHLIPSHLRPIYNSRIHVHFWIMYAAVAAYHIYHRHQGVSKLPDSTSNSTSNSTPTRPQLAPGPQNPNFRNRKFREVEVGVGAPSRAFENRFRFAPTSCPNSMPQLVATTYCIIFKFVNYISSK
jgi:hypothetical protein